MRKKLLNDQSLVHILKRYLFFAVLFFTISVGGQVSISSLPYTKSDNFNSYNPSNASNATSTLPSGWGLIVPTSPSYNGRGTGTGNSNGFWGFDPGGTTGTESSLGTVCGGKVYGYSVGFTNNSGTTITNITISWNYEQWRYVNAAGWDVTGTGQLATNTTLNAADFAGTSSGTHGSVTTTPKSIVLSGLNITNGQSFGIKWEATDDAGADSGVSIDDFSISVTSAITSTKSGDWSVGSTWVGGVAPTSADNVVIAAGHTVTGDVAITRAINTTTTINGTLVTTSSANTITNNGTTTVATTGALQVGSTYTTGGATNINGTFQINANGYGAVSGSGTYNWGSTPSTLIYNAGSYGPISGHPYWPTGSTNQPYNVTFNSGTVDLGSTAHTITGTVTLGAAVNNTSGLVVNGTLLINAGGSLGNSPKYGASSTLIYNTGGTYGRNSEWTASSGTVGTTAGFPQNVQLSNNTSLNFPNGSNSTYMANGNLTIDSGSTLYQGYSGSSSTLVVGGNVVLNGTLVGSDSSGKDMTIAGNWTKSASATFTPNGRAVIFNGSAAQSITGVTTFAYLDFNNSTAASILSINDNITVGNKLKLSNGKITIATGKTVTMADGANIEATSGDFSASNTGTISFVGTGTTTGTINFYPAVAQTPSGLSGVSYSTGSTIQTSLTLNSNSYVTSAPKYASGSTLIYNNTGTYDRGVEWGSVGTTFPANGYPHHVTVQNGTTLNIEVGLTGTLRANGNLNLGIAASAGSLNMQNTGNALEIKGNVNLGNTTGTSTLTLSTNSSGGNLSVGGSWVRNATNGTFKPNSKAVTFNGTIAQTITGTTTFDYLILNNSAGLTLSNSVNVNQILTLTSGKITLGSNDLIIASTGSISGGSSSSYVVTLGTGQLKSTVGSGAVVFPVGSASAYNPITFTNTGTSDVFGVILTSGTVPNVNDATYTVNDRWIVTEGMAGGSTLSVVPQWNTSDLNNATNFNAGTQLYVGFYNGTSWTQNTATVSGSNPYTANGAAVFSPSALSGTQYFAVGKDNAFKCGVAGLPYSQNFDSVTTPAMPSCWTVQDVNADGSTWTTSSAYKNTAPNSLTYVYNTSNAANDWAYTPGFALTAGVAYRVSFNYSTAGGASFPEKLKIGYGTTAVNTAMTTIADLGSLTNASYTAAYYDFVPSSTGTYYIGFNAYSDANMFALSIDDVSVAVSPPTLLVNSSTSATLSFGTNDIGSTVTSKTFSLSGANLTGAPSSITMTAPSGFQISSDGTTYGTSASVTYSSATLSSTTVYVKYVPTSCSVVSSGNITFSGGGVSSYPTVALSGTATLAKPIATAETLPLATGFTANWGAVTGASGYVLDVSTSPTFGTASTGSTSEGFETAGGLTGSYTSGSYTLSSGTWTGTDVLQGTLGIKTGAKSLQLKKDTGVITSPAFSNVTSLTFWASSSGTTLVVNKIVGGVTTQILSQALSSTTPTQYTIPVNDTSSNIQFQFVTGSTYTALDDVVFNYNTFTPSFVSPYNNYSVSGTSQAVSGLAPNTTYYYRVRATSGSCQSANSNVITACTGSTQYNVTGTGSYCAGGAGLAVGLSGSETGVSYQLKLNGSNVGAAVAGTGSALSFGNQTTAGTYTVVATNTTTCAIQTTMSTSAVITVNPTVDAGTISGAATVLINAANIPYSTSGNAGGTWSIANTGSAASIDAATGAMNAGGTAGTAIITYTINSGCGSPVSATYNVSISDVTTWTGSSWTLGTPTASVNGAIISPYHVGQSGQANFSVKDLKIDGAAGLLVIPANQSITVAGKITTTDTAITTTTDGTYTDGTITGGVGLVIDHDGNLLQTDANAVNTGKILARRKVTGMNNNGGVSSPISTAMDYVYWSSPVNGQVTTGSTGFSPGTPANRFYEYNESKDTFKATTDGTFVAGKGYAVRAETGANPDDAPNNYIDGYSKTYKFTGVPNNGDVSIVLKRTQLSGATTGVGLGFNMVGNPYPSNIDFTELYAANSSVIWNTAYFWTNNTFTKTQMGSGYSGYEYNNYAVFNGTGGNSASKAAGGTGDNTTPDGIVSVGQGFIVQAKNQNISDTPTATNTLVFKNSYSTGHDLRVGTAGHFFQKQSTDGNNRFWVRLTSPTNLVNTQLIGYVSGASNDFEQDYDAETLSTSSDVFYSVLGSRQLLIQGRSENFSTSDVVPLGANFFQDGTYKIGLDVAEGIFGNGQKVYLRDKLLGKTVDLSQGDYSFSVGKGLNNTRFEVVYKDDVVLGSDDLTRSGFEVYRDGDSYVVRSTRKLGKIQVYDAAGRLLRSIVNNDTTAKVDMSDISNGVYVLKVENSGDTKTKKIIK